MFISIIISNITLKLYVICEKNYIFQVMATFLFLEATAMPNPSPQPVALPDPHRGGGRFGRGRFGRGRFGRGRPGITFRLGPLEVSLGRGGR